MSAIVTLTLNPALDLSTAVDLLAPAVKLRCEPERVDPGGGGLNAACTVAALGEPALAVHCSGGDVGRRLQRLLDAEGVRQRVVPIAGETRESFAVTERAGGSQYRFVLPGPRLVTEEWRAGLAATVEAAGRDGLVLASGSLPRGVPDDCYARLARDVSTAGGRLLVDTAGAPLKAVLGCGAHLLKPNWREVGGGDAFAGALLVALARRQTLGAACRLGVAAAAAAVCTPGTAPPSRDAVERLYRAVGDEHVVAHRPAGESGTPLPAA